LYHYIPVVFCLVAILLHDFHAATCIML